LNEVIIMELKNTTISWSEFSTPDELSEDDRELVMEARKASGNAWAPYSGFHVGAAVRLENGLIIKGTNVENAAFPSGICAEQNVLSNAVSNFPGHKPVAMALAARNQDGFTADPAPPCGNCRQVIVEEELRNGTDIRLILSGESKIIVISKGSDLLPLQFSFNSMKVNLP
jgi:cytidine deaminase